MKKCLIAVLLAMLVLLSLKGNSEEVALSASEYLTKACDSLTVVTETGEPSAWRDTASYLRKALGASKPGDDSRAVAMSALKHVLACSPFLEDALELANTRDEIPEPQSAATGGKKTACVSFSPDGTRLVGGYADGTVEILDRSSLKATASLEGFWENVLGVTFSPDGESVIPVARGHWAYRFSLKDGSLLAKYDLKYHLASAVFSDDGRYLLLGSSSKLGKSEFKVFDAQTHELVSVHEEEGVSAVQMVFSRDGKSYLALGYGIRRDKHSMAPASLTRYDVMTGEKHSRSFEHGIYSWSGGRLCMQYAGKTNQYVIMTDFVVFIVDADTLEQEARSKDESLRTEKAIEWDVYDEESGVLWLVTRETLEELNVATGKFVSRTVGRFSPTTGAFVKSSRKLIVGNHGGEVYMFPDNTLLWKSEEDAEVMQLAVSPDGAKVLVSLKGGRLATVDLTHLRLYELLAKIKGGDEAGVPGLAKQLKSIKAYPPVAATEQQAGKGRDLMVRHLKASIVEGAPIYIAFAIEQIRSRQSYFGGEMESVAAVIDGVSPLGVLRADEKSPAIFVTAGDENQSVFAAFENGEVCIWRLSDGRRVLHEKLDTKVRLVVREIRGRFVSVVTRDNTIYSCNVNIGTQLHSEKVSKPIKSLQYADWGWEAVALFEDGTASIYKSGDGLIANFETDKKIVETRMAPDRKACATRYADGSVGLWALDYSFVGLIEDLKVEEEILDFQFDSNTKTTSLALLLPEGKLKIYTIDKREIKKSEVVQLPFVPISFGPVGEVSRCNYYLADNGFVASFFGKATQLPVMAAYCPLRGAATLGVKHFIADSKGKAMLWKRDSDLWVLEKEYSIHSPVTCISPFSYLLGESQKSGRLDLKGEGVVVGHEDGSVSFIN